MTVPLTWQDWSTLGAIALLLVTASAWLGFYFGDKFGCERGRILGELDERNHSRVAAIQAKRLGWHGGRVQGIAETERLFGTSKTSNHQ